MSKDKKSLLTIIKEKEIIKNLNKKTKSLNKKVNFFDAKIKSKFKTIPLIIFLSSFISLSYFQIMSYFNIITLERAANSNISEFHLIMAAVIFSFIASFAPSSIASSIVRKFHFKKKGKEDVKTIKYPKLDASLEEKPQLIRIVKKFENRLSEKEKWYMERFNFYGTRKNQLLFQIFFESMKETEIDELINNKNLIIKELKESFNIYDQKRFLKEMTAFIQENTIDKEIHDLDIAIEKVKSKRIKNEEVKELLIKSI